MFFLDIGYSHVFWTYQGLELRFSKTARELPGEMTANFEKSIFLDLRRDESLPVEEKSYRALVLRQSAPKISTSREHASGYQK